METLLSLTSKRAGDWFKEELRLLGGLDHIVDKGGCVIRYRTYVKVGSSQVSVLVYMCKHLFFPKSSVTAVDFQACVIVMCLSCVLLPQ